MMTAAGSSMRMIATFVAVGAAGAGAYMVLSTVIHAIGIEAWISSLASYAVLVPVVYLAQRGLTFGSRAPHLSSFPKYLITQLLGLTLSGGLPYFVTQVGGLPAIFAFACVAATAATVNFVLLRYWTFASPARVGGCGNDVH